MKYNIPTDWQEQDGAWVCYQIQWPLSDEWTRVLLGVLSSLQRGRAWAENSGTIVIAQAVGKEIFDKNAGLPLCAVAQENETVKFIWEYDLEGDEGESDDMTCLSCVIRVQDGVLQVKNSGCDDWTDIAVISGPGTAQELDQDIHVTDENPTPSYYACGKAWGAMSIVRKCVDACWEAKGLDVWDIVHNVCSAFGNADLDNDYIFKAVALAIFIDGEDGGNPADDSLMWQDILCKWVTLFEDDNSRLYNDQMQSMIDILYTMILSYNPFALRMVDMCINALDRAIISNAMLASAIDDSHNCDCHPSEYGELNPPDEGLDWVYVWDFTQSDHGFVAAPTSGAWSYGVGWEGGTYFDHGSRLIISKDGLAGKTYTSKYIGVVYSYHPGDNTAEGESDTVTAHSTLLSVANIALVEGDTSTYEREADVAIVQDTINSIALDFSDVDTDDVMIRVTKIIWAGTGDNPFS